MSIIIAALALAFGAAFAGPALSESFIGEWSASAHTPGGDVSGTLEVEETKSGFAITATLVGPVAKVAPVVGPGTDIVSAADRFSYQRTVTTASYTLIVTCSGVVSEDTFTGAASALLYSPRSTAQTATMVAAARAW